MLTLACRTQEIAEGGDRDAAAAAPAAAAAAPRAGSEAEGPATPPRGLGSGAAPPPAARDSAGPPAHMDLECDAAAQHASPYVEGSERGSAVPGAQPSGLGLGFQDPGHPAWRGGWGLDGGSHVPPRGRAASPAEGSRAAAELLGKSSALESPGDASGSGAGRSAASSPQESPFASTAVQAGASRSLGFSDMEPAAANGSAAQPPHSQPTSNGGTCKRASTPAPAPANVPRTGAQTQPDQGGAGCGLAHEASGPGLQDPVPRQQCLCAPMEGDAVHARSDSASAAGAAVQADQERRSSGHAAQRAGPGRGTAVEADGGGSAAHAGKAAWEGGAGQQAELDVREPVAEGGMAAGAELAAPGSEPQADSWLELHGVRGPLGTLFFQFCSLYPSTRAVTGGSAVQVVASLLLTQNPVMWRCADALRGAGARGVARAGSGGAVSVRAAAAAWHAVRRCSPLHVVWIPQLRIAWHQALPGVHSIVGDLHYYSSRCLQ